MKQQLHRVKFLSLTECKHRDLKYAEFDTPEISEFMPLHKLY